MNQRGFMTSVWLFLLTVVFAILSFSGGAYSQNGPSSVPELTSQIVECVTAFASDALGGEPMEADGIGFVFDEWHRMLEQRQPLPNKMAFTHFVNQVNSDECECRLGMPGLASKTLSRINRLVRGLVGAAVDPSIILKQGLSVEFARTGNDPDAVRALIERERTAHLDAFRESITADATYMEGYVSVFRRIQEARVVFPQKESEVVVEIKRAIDLSAQIRRIRVQINEQDRLPIIAENSQEKKRGSLLDLLEAEALLRKELRVVTKRLADMRSTTKFSVLRPFTSEEKPLSKIELFLLKEWAKLDDLKKASQIAMSKLYVTQERIKILDGILAGDLNRLEGPADSHVLERLVSTLDKYADYLSSEEIFGTNNGHGFGVGASDVSLYHRYSRARFLASRWLDVWHGRLTILRPRLEFTYTNQVLFSELRRFLTNNNPRGQGANLRDAAFAAFQVFAPNRWQNRYGDKPYRFDESRLTPYRPEEEVLPPEGTETAPQDERHPGDNRSVLARERVFSPDPVKIADAIGELAKIIRAHSQSGHISDEKEMAAYESALGSIHSYLVIMVDQKGPLDRQVIRAMASNDAMIIFNWMSELATIQRADGPGYSLLLAEKILEVQIAPLKRYQRLAPAITENVMVWVGAWYGLIPGLQHTYEFFKHWFGW